jgi:hypothetical protein
MAQHLKMEHQKQLLKRLLKVEHQKSLLPKKRLQRVEKLLLKEECNKKAAFDAAFLFITVNGFY